MRNTQCGLRRLRERELAGKNNSKIRKIIKIRLNKNRVGEDDWLAIPTPFFQNRVMPIQILSPGGNNIESDHYGSRALMRPCISAGCPLGCPVAASRASNPCAEVPAHPLSPERGASQSAKEEKKKVQRRQQLLFIASILLILTEPPPQLINAKLRVLYVVERRCT